MVQHSHDRASKPNKFPKEHLLQPPGRVTDGEKVKAAGTSGAAGKGDAWSPRKWEGKGDGTELFPFCSGKGWEKRRTLKSHRSSLLPALALTSGATLTPGPWFPRLCNGLPRHTPGKAKPKRN